MGVRHGLHVDMTAYFCSCLCDYIAQIVFSHLHASTDWSQRKRNLSFQSFSKEHTNSIGHVGEKYHTGLVLREMRLHQSSTDVYYFSMNVVSSTKKSSDIVFGVLVIGSDVACTPSSQRSCISSPLTHCHELDDAVRLTCK